MQFLLAHPRLVVFFIFTRLIWTQFRKTQEELGKADAFYLLFREHHIFFTSHNLQQSISLYYFPPCIELFTTPTCISRLQLRLHKASFSFRNAFNQFFRTSCIFFSFPRTYSFFFSTKKPYKSKHFYHQKPLRSLFYKFRLIFAITFHFLSSYMLFLLIFSVHLFLPMHHFFSICFPSLQHSPYNASRYFYILFHRKNHSLSSLSLHEFQYPLLLAGFPLVTFFLIPTHSSLLHPKSS